MIENCLPPSPNWYASKIADISKDGLLAYASRNAIVLFDVKAKEPSLAGSLHGHEERVVCVLFSRGQSNLCASGSDDKTVKLWDTAAKVIVKEHSVHESKVTSLDWNPFEAELLVSSDEKGCIVLWNHVTGEAKQWMPEANSAIVISFSPVHQYQVAVGYRNGEILILDLSQWKDVILHRLRGHEDEIHSLCWSPQQNNHNVSADGTKEGAIHDGGSVALLSGGKDRTIRLWDIESERTLIIFGLPQKNRGGKGRDRGDDGGAKSRIWVALFWPAETPRQFLSSSLGGDILLWNLDKPGKQKWTPFGPEHQEVHNRAVFSISSCPNSPYFVTTSMDRQIVLWNTETQQPEWCLPTVGGFVYHLAASPFDPGMLAIGAGDNVIRLWKTDFKETAYQVTSLWHGIRSKVTAVCWHPTREESLAFGTDDGKVGLFTCLHTTKSPVLSRTFHKKTVYSLSFGPVCASKDSSDASGFCIFSCGGDGVVYQHHTTSLLEEAVNLDQLIRETNSIQHMLPMRTDVQWRADGVAVAIGNEDGSIDILAAPNLLLLCSINVHHKIINCLQWFPEVRSQTPTAQQQKMKYWLASGSNESQVHVHDLSTILGGESPQPQALPITTSFRPLVGHFYRVTALDWDPFGEGKLVTVSYDGTAQVWDVERAEAVANFRGHSGRLYSILWSRLDRDVVYSGGEDFFLMAWRISQCLYTMPPTDKKDINVVFYGINKKKLTKGGKKSKSHWDANSVSKSKVNGAVTSVARKSHVQDGAKPNEKDLMSITELLQQKKQEILSKTPGNVQNGTNTDENISKVNGKESLQENTLVDINVSANALIGGGDAACIMGSVIREDVGSGAVGGKVSSYSEEMKEDSRPKVTEPESEQVKARTKKKRSKPLFPNCTKMDNRGKAYTLQDCVSIAQRKYDHVSLKELGEESYHLGLFGERRDAFQTIKAEAELQETAGNYDLKWWLNVWQMRPIPGLQKAIESGHVTDYMIAMAPMAGHDVWLQTCEAYARQLEANDDILKAATYYTVCHKVQEAIQVLKTHKLFKEAVGLASARLSPRDPVLADLHKCWAASCEAEGAYEQAARCYLAIDQPENAVRLLARKGNQSSLKAALQIALLADQVDIIPSLTSRYANECLMNGNWAEPWELNSSKMPILACHLLMVIHEAVCIGLEKLGTTGFELLHKNPKHSKLLCNTELRVEDLLSELPSVFIGESGIIGEAFNQWKKKEGDRLKGCSMPELGDMFKQLFQSQFDTNDAKQFSSSLAICIAHSRLSGSDEYMVRTLYESFCTKDYSLVQGVTALIAPQGFASEENLKSCNFNFHHYKEKDAWHGLLISYYAKFVLYKLWRSMPDSALLTPSTVKEFSELTDARTCMGANLCHSVGIKSSEGSKLEVAGSCTQGAQTTTDEATRCIKDSQDRCHCQHRWLVEDRYATVASKLCILASYLLVEEYAKFWSLHKRVEPVLEGKRKMVSEDGKDEHKRDSLDSDSLGTNINGVKEISGKSLESISTDKERNSSANRLISGHTDSELEAGQSLNGDVEKHIPNTSSLDGESSGISVEDDEEKELRHQIKGLGMIYSCPDPLEAAIVILMCTLQLLTVSTSTSMSREELISFGQNVASWAGERAFIPSQRKVIDELVAKLE